MSSSSYTAGIATPNTNSNTDIVFWSGGARDTDANFYVRADGTVVMKSAVITGYASTDSVAGLAKTDMSNVTTIDGGKITTGVLKNSAHSGVLDGSAFSTSGTAINLNNGTITSPKFRINSQGDAFFTGTLSAGTSLSSPQIQGGSIGAATITVSAEFTSSGLTIASDSDLSESNDGTTGGATSVSGNQSFTPTITIANGKISSDTMLRLESTSSSGYTEILAGGTQSAIFSNTKSSLKFTEGLYLGSTTASVGSSTTPPSGPYITVEGRMRLRKGAPLLYPGGTTGAYVRNIYIKQSTSTPSSTTGYVGDIFITY